MKVKPYIQASKEVFKDLYFNRNSQGTSNPERRHWSEKCWKMLICSLLLYFCSTQIKGVWMAWNKSPVVKGLSEEQTFISDIPFPMITICPNIKTKRDKFDVYNELKSSKHQNNLTNIERARIGALIHICNLDAPIQSYLDDNLTNESINWLIQDMAPTIDDTISRCTWKADKISCMNLFKPIFTDKGLCFIFNALNSHDMYTDETAPELMTITDNPNMTKWNLDDGYTGKENEFVYPKRSFSAQPFGLSGFLQIFRRDIDKVCRTPINGFNMFLSTPGEAFKTHQIGFHIPADEQVIALIVPTMSKAANELRRYKPDERKCFYSDERQLRFYKWYSKSSCQEECLANYTLKECGCVNFYMPRDKYTKVCGVQNCYKGAYMRLFGEDIIDGLTDENAKSFREQCNCMNGCTSIRYDLEIDRAKLCLDDSTSIYNASFDTTAFEYTPLAVFFKTYWVETFKQSERYTYASFLATCGGLLGLFLGLSAFSVIQFIVNVTIRLFYAFSQLKSNDSVQQFHHTTNVHTKTIDKINQDNEEAK